MKGLIAILCLTSAMWGLTGVFVHLLTPMSFWLIVGDRLFVASLVALLILIFSRTVWGSFLVTLRNPLAYFLSIVLVGYYLLTTIAFQLSSVTEAALLLSTPPFFVLLWRWLRNITPNLLEVIGALMALSGIIFVVVCKNGCSNLEFSGSINGDVSAICASALTACYAYIYNAMKNSNKAPDALTVSFLTFFIGSIVLGVVLRLDNLDAVDTGNQYVFIILGLGILSTAFPTIGFAIISRELSPLITSTASLLIPVFAGLFAFIFLDEKPSIYFFIGSAFVLAGVGMIIYGGSSNKKS